MDTQRAAMLRTSVRSSDHSSHALAGNTSLEADATRERVWNEIWRQRGIVMKFIAVVRQFLHRVHQRLLLRVLPPNADVLELGCGTASLTLSLAPQIRRLVGLDISEEALRIADTARQRLGIHNAEFVKGDCRSVPFTNAFDLVWSAGLIEHFFDDDWRIANEHLRAVKRGGVALMSVPAKYSLHHLHYLLTRPKIFRRFWPWSDVRHFQCFYNHRDLRRVAQRVGVPSRVFFLPPAPVGFLLGITILELRKPTTPKEVQEESRSRTS